MNTGHKFSTVDIDSIRNYIFGIFARKFGPTLQKYYNTKQQRIYRYQNFNDKKEIEFDAPLA